MMWLHNFCFVLFVGVVFGSDSELPNNKIINEVPCLSFGGTCVVKSECPSSKMATAGLCPVQQDDGIECCHSKDIKKALNPDEIDLKAWRNRPSIPQKADNKGMQFFETRCKYRGGECIAKTSECPDWLIHREASDCTGEQKCCILVN